MPTGLRPSFGPDEDRNSGDFAASSLGQLYRNGGINIIAVGTRKLHFEWHCDGAVVTELLRADWREYGRK